MLHKLPRVLYTLDDDKFVRDYRVITDIFTRIGVNLGSNRWSIIEKHTVRDGQKPEDIAEEKYENVGYWWVVLVANPQIRQMSDWPMSNSQLDDWLNLNFGSRMFETVSNGELDFDLPFLLNGELIDHHTIERDDQYEETTIQDLYRNANDQKRVINLITPQLLGDFVDEYEKALEEFKSELQQN